MSHDHDHAAMLASTITSMNHDHHSMADQMNTTIGAIGHGSHLNNMMMMAVSISFNNFANSQEGYS
jgi:hypothetical protein